MEDILAKAMENRRNCGIVGRAHYLAADHCGAMNRYLGVPVVVITALVGTTIFATLNENPDPFWKIVAGLVSLMGTVLASLQTYLGFSQAAEKHKTAGEIYRAERRRFDMFCLKYANAGPDQRDDAFIELQNFVDGLAHLPKEFPTVPDRFYEKARREHEGRGKTRARDKAL
ncbi:MAG: SLATT domain-containing protein [Desulfobacterales bacterium]|nr:SLATT domain-containing protein [Desulfobacterales bacterium]